MKKYDKNKSHLIISLKARYMAEIKAEAERQDKKPNEYAREELEDVARRLNPKLREEDEAREEEKKKPKRKRGRPRKEENQA